MSERAPMPRSASVVIFAAAERHAKCLLLMPMMPLMRDVIERCHERRRRR